MPHVVPDTTLRCPAHRSALERLRIEASDRRQEPDVSTALTSALAGIVDNDLELLEGLA